MNMIFDELSTLKKYLNVFRFLILEGYHFWRENVKHSTVRYGAEVIHDHDSIKWSSPFFMEKPLRQSTVSA